MLIDFQVGNFRSIRSPMTLSMVAASRGRQRALGAQRRRKLPADCDIAEPWPVEGLDFALLPVAVILGGNASGKSNLWKALHQFLLLVRNPRSLATPAGRPEPFLLAEPDRLAPTTYRIRLWDPQERDIVTYELELADIVVREAVSIAHGVEEPVQLFARERQHTQQPTDWRIHPDLASVAPLLEALSADTLALQFLLTTFDLPPLASAKRQLWHLAASSPSFGAELGTITCQHMVADPQMREAVKELVHRFDTGVQDIVVQTPDGGRTFAVTTVQQGAGGPVVWSIAQNSAGTQRLFELSSQLLAALRTGGLLSLDEFGAFFHPHITEQIIRMFQHRAHNPLGAQLVVNTHDVHLLDNHLLRRDQIWLTERQADGSTALVSLLDYQPRNDEALMTRYLQGRYGGVPMLGEVALVGGGE